MYAITWQICPTSGFTVGMKKPMLSERIFARATKTKISRIRLTVIRFGRFFMLGDIVISIPHAVSQAERFGHTLQREIAFLTVHSMLHLLGYDHEGGGIESVRMREKEETVLTQLGLPRSGSYYMGDE